MNILKLLLSKPHNTHYLHRYYNFIMGCKNNVDLLTNKNSELHHICPKAPDLFPEYTDGRVFKWNIIRLTYRQHFLAHYMLWKAFGGSQIYAFVGMCNQNNKRDRVTCKSSKIYADAKLIANKMSSVLNAGLAVYNNIHGEKVRCKTTDPRVLTGELISTSKGRTYTKRSAESRLKTSMSAKGKVLGPRSIEDRISRRKNKNKLELFFNKNSNSFVEIDPILADLSYVKVFTSGKIIWNNEGKYRRCNAQLTLSPPGWFFIDPTKIFRVVNLSNNNYIECKYNELPENFTELTICKYKKISLYCITLMKNIVISHESFQKHGCPNNCIII